MIDNLLIIYFKEYINTMNLLFKYFFYFFIKGMTYLHDSSLRSHGNLKSSKCLVDSRWVVKIADFGLHELKFGAEAGDQSNTDFEKQCESK